MNVPTMSTTMVPIKTKTPILRYHIPALVESGHRGCMVRATAPITEGRERRGREREGRERERERERESKINVMTIITISMVTPSITHLQLLYKLQWIS